MPYLALMESVTIRTTQNVSIDYELAKTGTRIGSFVIDVAIFGIAYNLTVILLAAIIPVFATELMFVYGNLFFLVFYFFLMEMLNRGQTLGKRIVGIKVIRLDGQDPTPADFITRAIFMMPDIIFSAGIPAVLLISSGKHKQRLGDIVAGTVVIQSAVSTSFTLREIMAIRNREDHEAEFPEVQQFTDADMMVVKHALGRMRKYGNLAHRQAVRQLAMKLADQMGLEKAEIKYTAEQFLEKLLLDYIVLTR
ncbi:MAG: RDD family protein [Bacteroidota bacterium]